MGRTFKLRHSRTDHSKRHGGRKPTQHVPAPGSDPPPDESTVLYGKVIGHFHERIFAFIVPDVCRGSHEHAFFTADQLDGIGWHDLAPGTRVAYTLDRPTPRGPRAKKVWIPQ